MGFLSAGNHGAMVAGAGCASADGQLLRLHFTAHSADFNFFQSYECDFLVPSLSGDCQVKTISDNDLIGSFAPSATTTRCTENNP